MLPEQSTSLKRVCALATGLTLGEVTQIAATGPKRYKVYQIPKRSGAMRTICHPSRELKALQYVFLRDILSNVAVHDSATAYKSGASIKDNASRHLSSRIILKLDFQDFFPSIKVEDWIAYTRTTFPHWTEQDVKFSAYVMFWGAGGYEPICLSIGAPTSPHISNALMFEFDEIISAYAVKAGLVYTRYADDITFSSDGYLDKASILDEVALAIDNVQFPKLQLNSAKTKLASKSTSRRVTGLVLANDGSLSIGRDRKRLISAMVHHAITGQLDADKVGHLAGLLSFASDVEPTFIAALCRKYGAAKIDGLQLRKAPKCLTRN